MKQGLDNLCRLSRDVAQNAINKLKRELGVKCLCNNSQCAECLSVNCKDENCPIHTKEYKTEWRRIWEINKKTPLHK